MLSAGQLRHPLTLQNPTVSGESAGGYSETWANASPATLWCQVSPASGATEGVSNNAERAPITHDVICRYHASLTAKSRLVFGSRYLYVRGIANVDERNRVLQLACEERPS